MFIRMFSIRCKWSLHCISTYVRPPIAAMQSSRRQPMTLRIERSTRQRFTLFSLSGRLESAQIPELEELFDRDYRNIILDLRDLRLADRDAVRFLRGCERDGTRFENCPAYVREWMDREKD
jgi:hypothetical protein